MSRTIWPSILLVFAATVHPVRAIADDQLIDYKAALSAYLGEAAAESANLPSQNVPAAPRQPATTAPQGAAVMPTVTAGPRESAFSTAAVAAVPGRPTLMANPVQAATPGSFAASGTVTQVSGAENTYGTTTATQTAPALGAGPTPELALLPPVDAGMNDAPTFLGNPAGTGNIMQQDGVMYYMEPIYDDAISATGGLPMSGAAPCDVVLCETASCQQCCASLCGCRACRSPLWLQSELLLWGVKGQYIPPLLTQSPAGTPATDIGVLGLPTTQTVFGGDRFGDNMRIGGRVRGGFWFGNCRKYGLEADYFYLGEDADNVRATSDTGELFARPFYNTNPAVLAADAELLVAPNIASSVFEINTSSEIYSVAPTFRWNLYCCESTNCCCEQNSTRLDFLAGYRYLRFQESIKLSESFEPTGPFYAPGTTFEFYDGYAVENEFHGAELGLNYMTQRSRWVLDMTAKLGLGNLRSTCSIDGYSRVVVPGALDQTMTGGFLTAGSQLGTTERDKFALLPQADVRLGYCMTPNLRFHVGYSFLFLQNVIRPGSLISTQVDSDDFLVDATPDPNDPGLDKDAIEEGVWLQGVNFGFTYGF